MHYIEVPPQIRNYCFKVLYAVQSSALQSGFGKGVNLRGREPEVNRQVFSAAICEWRGHGRSGEGLNIVMKIIYIKCSFTERCCVTLWREIRCWYTGHGAKKRRFDGTSWSKGRLEQKFNVSGIVAAMGTKNEQVYVDGLWWCPPVWVLDWRHVGSVCQQHARPWVG